MPRHSLAEGGARDTPLTVLEAGYRLSTRGDDWLREVAESARPALDVGMGVTMQLYRVTDTLVIGAAASAGTDAALITASHESMRRAAQIHLGIFSACRVCTQSELLSQVGTPLEIAEPILAPMRALGCEDTLTIQVCDADGFGIFLAAALPKTAQLSPGARRRWRRVGAHLLAAARLRRAIDARAGGEVAMVVGPGGKSEVLDPTLERHALRRRLVDEARAIRRARDRRGPADDALGIWRGLMAGLWSVVDSVDQDAHRYLVLRKNAVAHGLAPEQQLSARERDVAAYLALGWANKEIAYALGISDGSVATLIARLRRKLGAPTRAHLVVTCSRLPRAPLSQK